MPPTNQAPNAVIRSDEKPMEFIPYGCGDKIKLSVEIVRNLIAVPSKSGKLPGPRDCIRFMMLAQAKRLNPFDGDAFLLGYDLKDGNVQFSLITAHQAYLKRAELHPEYDGMRSGIIVQNEDGSLQDLEGDFHMDSQTVVGGWASVTFKTRKTPTHRRVRLKRFQKPWGVWQDDPAGMICKVAEADALRSSFPTMLGGLYLREEIDISANVSTSTAPEFSPGRLVEVKSSAVEHMPSEEQAEKPIAHPEASLRERTPQDELQDFVLANGFTFDNLVKWGTETGNIEDAGSLGSFADVPTKVAARLLKAKAGLAKGLAEVKGVGV